MGSRLEELEHEQKRLGGVPSHDLESGALCGANW